MSEGAYWKERQQEHHAANLEDARIADLETALAAKEQENAELRDRLTAFNQERERVETELRESRKMVAAAELKAEALATAVEEQLPHIGWSPNPEVVAALEAALDAHRAENPQ